MRGFNSLPAEIIEIIFKMAYENETDDFLPLQYAHPRSRKAVTGRRLLVPLHISSWIRAVNLSNPSVWSSSAEMVLASKSSKGNARLYHLLRFCADCSSALERLDFDQLADDRGLWAQEVDPFLGIIEASAASIEHLRLHDLYQRSPDQCSCSACSSSGELDTTTLSSAAIESVWTRLFNVLCRAASLKTLEFEMPAHLPDPHRLVNPAEAAVSQPRPKQLRLRIWSRQRLSEQLQSLFTSLSSRVSILQVHVASSSRKNKSHDLEDPTVAPIAPIIEASAASVEELRLFSGQAGLLAFPAMFKLSFPVLSKLLVHLEYGMSIPQDSSSDDRCYLPALTYIEVPAALLHFFEAPWIQSAALTFRSYRRRHRNDNGEGRLVIEALQQWSGLEDLVLHSPTSDDDGLSSRLGQIIEELMPHENESSLRCPSLERLSIMARERRSDASITETAFVDPQQLGNLDLGWSFCRPKLGIDFALLAKTRRDWSTGQGSSTSSHVGKCKPLKIIRIFGCLVNSTSWNSLLAGRYCEYAWCWPDPNN